MKENWEESFRLMLKSEGGYANDKDDPGGETNLGVTKRAWQEYLKRPVLDGEMAKLTVDMVKPFYKSWFWDKCKCDELPDGVDYLVFDFAVNAGVSAASKMLQRSVNAVPDGIIGPKTIGLVHMQEPSSLIAKYTDLKIQFYKDIVSRRPVSGKYLTGWLNRVTRVEEQATRMA